MKITIAHLYPDLLNLYGDNGNIAALSYRLRKRNISVEVVEYQIGDSIDFNSTDILFIGGGSDKEMLTVANEICSYSNDLKTYSYQYYHEIPTEIKNCSALDDNS